MVIPARAPISRVLQFQHWYLLHITDTQVDVGLGRQQSKSFLLTSGCHIVKRFSTLLSFHVKLECKKNFTFKILMVHWCLNWRALPISRSCLGESRSNITRLYFVSWFKQTTDKLQTEGLFTWLPLSSAPTPVPAVNSSLSLWVLWPRAYIQ